VAASTVFLVLPWLRAYPARRAWVLRISAGCGALYFFARTLLPRDGDTTAGRVLFPALLVLMLALVVGARRLAGSPLGRPLRSFGRHVRGPRGELPSAMLLFGAWLVVGLRFGCLGDLDFGASPVPYNIDDELLETYVALLAVQLAGAQLGSPVARDPSGRPIPSG